MRGGRGAETRPCSPGLHAEVSGQAGGRGGPRELADLRFRTVPARRAAGRGGEGGPREGGAGGEDALGASWSGDWRFPDSAKALGTCQKSSLKLFRKFALKGWYCMGHVCERFSPFWSPFRPSQSLSSWQPPPPDWTGLDSSGVPAAAPPPAPSPSPAPCPQRIGFSCSSFGQDRGVEGGGGGGENNLSGQSRAGERVAGPTAGLPHAGD